MTTAFGLFDMTMVPKLQRLLKVHGLRLKVVRNRNWGDQVEVSIMKRKPHTGRTA